MLLIVCLLMLFLHLGKLQTNIMESRNFITAREMVQDGNWVFTTINGEPRYEKPPLPTWITAGFGAVFGFENLFWLRLPAALVTLMLMLYFFRITKLMAFKREQSYAASLILITSFYIFFAGRDNQWDIWCHAFMTGSIFYSLRYFMTASYERSQSSRGKRTAAADIALGGLFFGLSFLSKGPVSVYALWLPFVIALFISGLAKRTVLIKGLVITLLIGLLLGFSWPLYVRFFDEASVTKAVAQEAGRWGRYNAKPFWYYWSFFLQSGLWALPTLIAMIFPFMRKRANNLSAYRLSFVWALGAIVLLSFIPEKKARYLLPTLIPLALITSFYIQFLFDQGINSRRRTESILHLFIFALPGLAALVLAGFVFWLLLKDRNLVSVYTPLALLIAILGFSIMSGTLTFNFRRAFYSAVLLMCATIALIPLSAFYFVNPAYASAGSLAAVEKNNRVKTFDADPFVPEIVFDYGKKISRAVDISGEIKMHGGAIGLLMHPGNEKLFLNDSLYNYRQAGKVDLNFRPAGKKGYNNRLVKNYYIVKLK